MSSLDLLGRFHDFMIWKLRFEAIAYAAIVEGVLPNQEPLSISAWLFFFCLSGQNGAFSPSIFFPKDFFCV